MLTDLLHGTIGVHQKVPSRACILAEQQDQFSFWNVAVPQVCSRKRLAPLVDGTIYKNASGCDRDTY
jgi:hypothetical protein